jgi:RNA polymerase primary sigma factor
MTGTHPNTSSSPLSPLATYLRQIDQTPLLTAQQERELAYRIEDGDCEAREHLVRANLRLVVNLARRYQGKGLDLQDLVAEGNLGLLRAAEAFDASMNTRFSTYAAYWVKQSIRRALLNMSRTIRLPAYITQLLTEWWRATARLHEELGRPPTEDEVATRLNLSQRKLRLIKKAIRIHNALPQGDDGRDGPTLDDLGADSRTPPPDAALGQAEELQEVLKLVDDLDERAKSVLRLRFGLGGEEPQTLQQVGERLGLTRERVRQIEREALIQLNEKLVPE